MRSLVVLALVWCCSAQLVIPRYGVPFPWAHQYRTQDFLGQTSFGHFTFDQNRQETRLADGRVVGQFSYIDSEGKPAVTFYEAGPEGYRVRANNLPVAPTADLVAPVDNQVPPEPVQYTPEVAQAREAFQAKFDEAKGKREKRQATFFTYPVGKVEDETKPFPLVYHTPYTPYTPFTPYTPYAGGFFPYIYARPLAAEKPESKDNAVAQARRRRDVGTVQIPHPFVHVQPTVVDHTFKTHQFEPAEAATPADTTKIELTTKEHKIATPAVKYSFPAADVKPLTYSVVSPAVHPLTYTAFSSGDPISYTAAVNPTFLPYASAFPYYNPFIIPQKSSESP
ncbi:uncharacterized protein [Panulirus ornatus]|uniref:uncharacterized protein n=1 Tax=Panulirus ornatus TaxID=150431 RepID=UPI003A84C569